MLFIIKMKTTITSWLLSRFLSTSSSKEVISSSTSSSTLKPSPPIPPPPIKTPTPFINVKNFKRQQNNQIYNLVNQSESIFCEETIKNCASIGLDEEDNDDDDDDDDGEESNKNYNQKYICKTVKMRNNSTRFNYQDFEELVGSKSKTNYKKIGLIVGGVLVAAAVIAVIVVFTTRSNDEPSAELQTITLADFLTGTLYARKNNGTWISDNELIHKDIHGNLVKYNVETKVLTTILAANSPGLLDSFTYELSADKQYLLVSRNTNRLFRHSSVAFYNAINVNTQQEYNISSNGSNEFLFLAEWSTVGNAIVFVQANNIYYKSSITADAVQITTDGSRAIQYGTCDWVYEEEVFASKTALWFSPDGTKLAYIRFDDTYVHLMNIPIYGTPGSLESQYTQTISIHYPKVGTANPHVTLFSVDLTTSQSSTPVPSEMKVPQSLAEEDHIITAVGWQNNQSFVSCWMNRVQNQAILQTCLGSNCRIFKTINSTTGWVELFKVLQFSPDGNQMVIIAPQAQGDNGRYYHVTLVSMETGNETPLTSGRFVVTGILKWNAQSNRIFYTANTAERSEIQHLYAVKAQPGQISQCLTCVGHQNENGIAQTYFSADFSSSGTNFVLITEGPSVPRVDLYKWNVNSNDDSIQIERIEVLDTNKEMGEIAKKMAIPKVVYLNISLSSGYDAKVKLLIPPNADITDSSVKYPMLVDVYAGPDSYNGFDKWDMTWGSYLASNQSIIFAQINGRGSGLRGEKLLHEIYRKFGTVEIQDQIETAKKLGEQLDYIDSKRVGIWGWSYGGYSAAMALAKDNDGVFKCAASVAPVTDWTYYDSIYTERYMGLPNTNSMAYETSRLSTMQDAFRDKTFYLIHGTMDDNVHYQQSMALARNLETHDILFKQMSYPDEDHSLWQVRTHLYHSLGRYFAECFDLDLNV